MHRVWGDAKPWHGDGLRDVYGTQRAESPLFKPTLPFAPIGLEPGGVPRVVALRSTPRLLSRPARGGSFYRRRKVAHKIRSFPRYAADGDLRGPVSISGVSVGHFGHDGVSVM